MFKPTQCNAYYNPNFVICYYIERIRRYIEQPNSPQVIIEYKWAIKADMVGGSTITITTCDDESCAKEELKGLIGQ